MVALKKGGDMLTPKQLRALRAIERLEQETTRAPTVAELREILGSSSTRAVEKMLSDLEMEGMVTGRRLSNQAKRMLARLSEPFPEVDERRLEIERTLMELERFRDILQGFLR